MPDILLNIVAGISGGIIFGALGYLNAWKEGEPFDWQKFAKNVAPAAIAGLGFGVASDSWLTALLAGLSGSAVANLGAKFLKN